MPSSINQFYECDNPECKLRFPGFKDQPHWKRCPACRSSIHIVAKGISIAEQDFTGNLRQQWQVEVILDNIRSAWNVGSIFRTADGIGIKKLYLCGITPTPETDKVRKTALGAEVSVPWEKFNNGVSLARQLKSAGYQLWALEDIPGAWPLYEIETDKLNARIVMIVGNEVSGIDPGIIELCDSVISIPMSGKKQSYNVAVAFGIAASFLLYRHSVFQSSLKIFPNT